MDLTPGQRMHSAPGSKLASPTGIVRRSAVGMALLSLQSHPAIVVVLVINRAWYMTRQAHLRADNRRGITGKSPDVQELLLAVGVSLPCATCGFALSVLDHLLEFAILPLTAGGRAVTLPTQPEHLWLGLRLLIGKSSR